MSFLERVVYRRDAFYVMLAPLDDLYDVEVTIEAFDQDLLTPTRFLYYVGSISSLQSNCKTDFRQYGSTHRKKCERSEPEASCKLLDSLERVHRH